MKQAVLFDLDGTLWDSTPQITASWNLALAPHGIHLTLEQVQGVMGKTAAEIGAVFFPDRSQQEQQALFDACSDAEMAYLRQYGGKPYPHLEQILKELARNYSLCLVSNCQTGYIETFFHCTGLAPLFSDTECAGRTGLPKGENIRLVMERNGFDRAVYVGDTQKDLDAARQAGIPFLHAAYGFGTVDPALPAAASPSELLTLLPYLL